MITIQLDEGSLKRVEQYLKEFGSRARFAASVGLNRTANEVQDGIRASLNGKFTLRREAFVKNTIYRKPGEDFASKDKLTAGVRVNEERNILAKFEAGGLKTPTGGRRFLAIPIDVKRNKSDIVTRANSIKALLASGKAFLKNGKVWLKTGRGGKQLKLAYVLKPSVKIEPDLQFVATGTRIALDRLAPNVIGAIQVEIDRGLSTAKGPSA